MEVINDGKADHIYTLPHALVSNGMKPETDCSYVRGYKNEKLYLKQRGMSWIVGFIDVMIELKNKELLRNLLPAIHPTWKDFYNHMYWCYAKPNDWLPICEALRALPWKHKIALLCFCYSPVRICNHGNGYYYLHIFSFFNTKIWKAKK